MTQPEIKAIPSGIHTITPHLVVRDAAQAAEWYKAASPLAIGGTPVVLHFSTDNVDALWKRAVDAGAKVLQPLQDQFWGDRYGQIIDPFGYRWGLAQHIRDISREEITRSAAKVFGGSQE